MKKRVFLLSLVVIMLLSGFSIAYASDISVGSGGASGSDHCCTYYDGKYTVIVPRTEGKDGIIRYFCDDYKNCNSYYDEAIPRLPDVYVSKFRHAEAGLCAKITVAQKYSIKNGEINISMENWFASQMSDKYNYNWEGENIRKRSVEFKAKDVGIGCFNDEVNTYTLSIPLHAVTDCDENGAVVVYLTTGAAMIRLSEDATAALLEDAKESIGVVVSSDGDKVCAQLLADGEEVDAPNGVEMLYWVKDAGDMETAPENVLNSHKYMNFKFDGDFDLIYVESLNDIVNCNK